MRALSGTFRVQLNQSPHLWDQLCQVIDAIALISLFVRVAAELLNARVVPLFTEQQLLFQTSLGSAC